jgi:poly-gamma-glutamate synthesis protein (capsule biosynthesis protein)
MMPEYKRELRPVDLPRDGFELMDTEGSFSKKIHSIVNKAEAKGLWKAPEDVPIVLNDHYFWAYWLYKTAHPIKQPMPGYNLEEYFAPFLTDTFDLNPEGFESQHTVEVSFVGDLMATKGLNNSADTLYNDVAHLIFDADFAYANLESTLTTQPIAPLEYSTDKPTIINITPQAYNVITRWKQKCYDLVHLANNHVLDCGEEGIETTLAYLRRDSIRQIGINETVADQMQPTITEVQGISIGWVAHTYDVDSMPYPPGKPHIVNMTPFHMVADPDLSLIETQIKSCRDAGCDFVIVSLHWGLEFELYPHPDQLKWAHWFAECGADMIVGHHPHVIQHMEIYRPKRNPQRPVPIIYSLGNLTPIQSHPATVASVVARLSLAQGKCGGQSTTYPTQLRLAPVVTLQRGAGDSASLGIYDLSRILSQTKQKITDQLTIYLTEVVNFVDSVIGSNWRD